MDEALVVVILVDTNTWAYFLNGSRPTRITHYLATGRLRTCDVVIGELCLGAGMPEPFRVNLLKLPRIPSPTAEETLSFIDRHQDTVAGSGVGWADVQILVTAERAGALLYTEDEALRGLWLALGHRLADGGPRRD